ncbi:PadR family transcriptional regulator [Cellulomonas rhizosphaerae]|uniref:PadR family transcriptional regulator n=1 Tax=Cellulomonas rhizosphaerae TaxID=2293719 RepID=A0A413RNR5_9CELL|nr:PadR family transcriptional regulator [Cellulomonas rhizosphaerae]RHA43662.1 PadR family transcriptional regulator [Cellulomonas rhizosphaerae]
MATRELSAVAVLLLALLHEQPMHPYQLHQALVERGDTRLVRVNAGAVYHGIERLEQGGLVEVVGTDRDGRRPERTTYRLTDAGRAAFAVRLRSLLGDEHPPYPLFSVGLAEADELPAADVAYELRRRREREETRRAELTARHAFARANGLPRRYALDVERDVALMATEIAWLDTTIGELERGELDWDSPFPADYKARKAAARSEAAADQHHTSSTTEPKDTP